MATPVFWALAPQQALFSHSGFDFSQDSAGRNRLSYFKMKKLTDIK